MNHVNELFELLGYPPPAWLRGTVEKYVSQSSDPETRQLAGESAISMAVPTAVEQPSFEPIEDPFAESTPLVFALYVCGLFTSDAIGPSIGGSVDDRVYATDLNDVANAIYACTTNGEVPESFERYQVLSNGHPETISVLRKEWTALRNPDLEPSDVTKMMRAFFDAHPGVSLAQELPRRGKINYVPSAPPMPAFLSEALDAAMLIGPAFIAAEGLPKFGSSKSAGTEALTLLTSAPDDAHREMSDLVVALCAWTAGSDRELAARLEKLSKSSRPLTTRWLERIGAGR